MSKNPIFVDEARLNSLTAEYWLKQLLSRSDCKNVTLTWKSLTDRTVNGATLKANIDLNLVKVLDRLIADGFNARIFNDNFILVTF